MANKRKNFGITTIIGTALLLAMAIGLFSVLNVIVFSFPVHPRSPSVSLVASVEYTDEFDFGSIVVEHNGGEALSKDDIQIVVSIFGSDSMLAADGTYSSDDELFSIGHRWKYDSGSDLRDGHISVTVVHLSTNSILMMGEIQAGEIS